MLCTQTGPLVFLIIIHSLIGRTISLRCTVLNLPPVEVGCFHFERKLYTLCWLQAIGNFAGWVAPQLSWKASCKWCNLQIRDHKWLCMLNLFLHVSQFNYYILVMPRSNNFFRKYWQKGKFWASQRDSNFQPTLAWNVNSNTWAVVKCAHSGKGYFLLCLSTYYPVAWHSYKSLRYGRLTGNSWCERSKIFEESGVM